MAYIMLLLSTVFAVLIAAFAIQNSAMVQVHFITRQYEISLVFVILGAAVLGFLVSLSIDVYIQIKLRFRLYKQSQRIRQLEQQLQKNAAARPEMDAAIVKLQAAPPANRETEGEKTV